MRGLRISFPSLTLHGPHLALSLAPILSLFLSLFLSPSVPP